MTDATLAGENAAAAVENAAERQFGPEFQDIHILSNAQVAVILQVSARSAVNRDEELNEVYRKTQKYVERFNTMTNPEKDHQELVEELDNLQEYVFAMRSLRVKKFSISSLPSLPTAP
jgi:DNA-directed RNA polymerase II subunit RPB4